MENSAETRNGGGATGTRSRRGGEGFRPRGPRSWSPLQPGSTYDPDEDRHWLEREITLLERALGDQGEMRRGQLGEIVACKYWGPQRFSRALKAATEQGRIRHTGLGRYGPVD